MSTTLEWSAHLGGKAPPCVDAPRLAAPLEMWPLAARACVVRNPLNGATARLNADEYALLSACEGARTVAQHEADVVARFNVPPADRPAVVRLLQRACEHGLLIPLDELVQRSNDASVDSDAPCMAVVRTADRPELLERLLRSAEGLERAFGYAREWHVLDDSREPQHRTRNRAIAGQSALSCTWHDLHASDALRTSLDATFPQAQREIAWLLGSTADGVATYGRPVNDALLRFAGRRWLAIDDDALLDARQCPLPGAFGVGSENDELLVYASQEEALAACAPVHLDPLAEHERWLGIPLADAWARAGRAHGAPTLALARSDAHRFGAGARIAFTQNGAVDDPGSSLFPFHLLSLRPASLAHATVKASRARAAFCDRHAWRGARELRLAPQRLLTFTTVAGIDNRLLLPPTVPTQRNEDLLFGGLAQVVHPRAWFVDLPFGLPHLRAQSKQWLPATATFAQEPLHFLLDALQARGADLAAHDAADRIATLGALAVDFGRESDRELGARLEAHAIDTASRVLFSIHAQLDAAAVPGAWKDALRPWLASPALAIEGPALRERLASTARVRNLCLDYGAALAVWPTLWHHCREAMA